MHKIFFAEKEVPMEPSNIFSPYGPKSLIWSVLKNGATNSRAFLFLGASLKIEVGMDTICDIAE